MGFSLKYFFDSLNDIIESEEENLVKKYLELVKIIEHNYKYAKECGQFK